MGLADFFGAFEGFAVVGLAVFIVGVNVGLEVLLVGLGVGFFDLIGFTDGQ